MKLKFFRHLCKLAAGMGYNLGRRVRISGSCLPSGVRTMATAAQIEANRCNAQMSTGPRTASGKARASLNATKHGRRAEAAAPVLPQEDPDERDEKIRRWVEDLQPVGDT